MPIFDKDAFLNGVFAYCDNQGYGPEKTAELLEKIAEIFEEADRFEKHAQSENLLSNIASSILPTAILTNIISDRIRQRQQELNIWQQIAPFLLTGVLAGGAGMVLYPIIKKTIKPISDLTKKEYILDKRIETMKQLIRMQEAANKAQEDSIVDATNPGRRAIAL